MAKLTDQVGKALRAIEAIQSDAGKLDKRVADAEQRAKEAEAKAAKAVADRDEALSKVDGLERAVIEAAGKNAAEMAALQASNELLARRDREARDELSRIHLDGQGQPKVVKTRGVTTAPADNYE